MTVGVAALNGLVPKRSAGPEEGGERVRVCERVHPRSLIKRRGALPEQVTKLERTSVLAQRVRRAL